MLNNFYLLNIHFPLRIASHAKLQIGMLQLGYYKGCLTPVHVITQKCSDQKQVDSLQ